jgi:tripartite-type tricarboxylate transporter receptor subunit TctC
VTAAGTSDRCGAQVPRIANRLSAALALALAVQTGAAWAQAWPAKPVRIVVPTTPGGSADTLTRVLATRMTDSLGQQIVVENRAGSAAIVGTEAVARATPDGYTLLMAWGSHVINPGLYGKLPYDTLKDFTPIVQVAVQPLMVMVHPSLPAKTLQAFIAFAKKQPGRITYATAGTGSGGHLAGELFASVAGFRWTPVPYKGIQPAMADLIGGHVDAATGTLVAGISHVRAGKLRGLAVTSLKRSSGAPDIPTMAESGLPGFEVYTSYYLLGPASTPRTVVDRMNAEVVKALQHPEVKERLARDGADGIGGTPEQLQAHLVSEIARWTKVIRQAGVKVD